MQEADIYNIITQSRNEISAVRSNALLLEAMELSKELKKNFVVVQSKILRELAFNSLIPSERKVYFDKAINSLETAIKEKPNHILIALYADIIIDAYQDSYTFFFEHIVRKRLANARLEIHRLVRDQKNLSSGLLSYLLSRLSAIIRAQAFSQYRFSNRFLILDKAKRTAEIAIKAKGNNPNANLELASCLWPLSRYAKTDEDYNDALTKAEDQFLITTKLKHPETANLALARFYRLTYQSSKSCDLYNAVSKYSVDRRRVLRESYVFSEAVQHLWYLRYPEKYLSPLLDKAIRENQLAIDAGHRYARHIVNLATLYAMSGDINESETILSTELHTKGKSIDWNSLTGILTSDKAVKYKPNDLLKQGLSLGINSPVVLNKIGTFCADFMNNYDLALAFYNSALKSQPNNAMFLTNKARILIKINDHSTYNEIDRLLQRAKSYSDRHFTWWRAYLNDLNDARGYKKAPRKPERTLGPMVSFNDRRLDYYRIKKIKNPNQRGLEYEKFIAAMVSVSFTESRGSHITPGAQNDAFFIHKGVPFRVEVKWEKDPVKPRTIREFYARINIAGMSGVFISYNGYSHESVEYGKRMLVEKCVLFVNGTEIERIVEGEISFYDLIDFKYLSFMVEENPYKEFNQ